MITFARISKQFVMKELLYVCIGSFLGGGIRYLSGKCIALLAGSFLPFATFAVNISGSFLIGWLSALAIGNTLSPSAKLLLITGFCGGFTTFSTFINENLLLARGGHIAWAILYTIASIAVGIAALIAGYKTGS